MATKVVDLGEMSITFTADASFKAAGFSKVRRNILGAKLSSKLVYKWYVDVAIEGQGSKRYPASATGYIFTYPVTKVVRGTTNVYKESYGDYFFEDTIDDKLGGQKEILGG